MRDEKPHIRPDAERDDGHHRQEEDEPDQRAAAAPERQARGLAGDRAEGSDHAAGPSAIEPAGATGRGRCKAAIAMPPAARWRSTRPPSIASPDASSDVAGSSRSQTRPGVDEEPRQRDAPLLPGRERGDVQVVETAYADAVERIVDVAGALPQAAPEEEILPDGQARLQSVEVAEIVDRLRPPFRRLRVERYRPVVGAEQPGDQPEQRRLAGAIGAGHGDQVAGGKRKREPLEDAPPATRDRKVAAAQAHAATLAARSPRAGQAPRPLPPQVRRRPRICLRHPACGLARRALFHKPSGHPTAPECGGDIVVGKTEPAANWTIVSRVRIISDELVKSRCPGTSCGVVNRLSPRDRLFSAPKHEQKQQDVFGCFNGVAA